jgi:hypothetical protein
MKDNNGRPKAQPHEWVKVRDEEDATEFCIELCARCGAARFSEWGTLPWFRPPAAEQGCSPFMIRSLLNELWRES